MINLIARHFRLTIYLFGDLFQWQKTAVVAPSPIRADVPVKTLGEQVELTAPEASKPQR